MNTELIEKISELIERGYTFLAVAPEYDASAVSAGIRAVVRSMPLKAYADITAIATNGIENLQLAHSDTQDITAENSDKLSDNLIVVNPIKTELVLSTQSNNAMIGNCQNASDYMEKTGNNIAFIGYHRQERGSAELKKKVKAMKLT